MGGKRADQHNEDSRAMDQKVTDDDPNTHEEDKEKLQSNPKDQPMIPESGVNPALRALRERKGQSGRNE